MTDVILAVCAILGLICVVGLAFCVWGLICNERTAQQRKRLIDRWPHGPEFFDYVREYDAVPYGDHMWALILLRDPKTLYGPLTQRLWQ